MFGECHNLSGLSYVIIAKNETLICYQTKSISILYFQHYFHYSVILIFFLHQFFSDIENKNN